jgi:hypothetical protein
VFRAAISAASTLADSSAGPPAALAEEIGLKNDQLAAFSEVGFLFDNRLSNAGLQLQLGVFTVALFTKVNFMEAITIEDVNLESTGDSTITAASILCCVRNLAEGWVRREYLQFRGWIFCLEWALGSAGGVP